MFYSIYRCIGEAYLQPDTTNSAKSKIRPPGGSSPLYFYAARPAIHPSIPPFIRPSFAHSLTLVDHLPHRPWPTPPWVCLGRAAMEVEPIGGRIEPRQYICIIRRRSVAVAALSYTLSESSLSSLLSVVDE